MRAPASEVRVDEDQDVTGGDEEALPQRLALAGVGAEAFPDVAAPVHDRARPRRHLSRLVGGVGIHHHQLIDQRLLPHERAGDGADDRTDRRLLVTSGDHHAGPDTLAVLPAQQPLQRPVLPARRPPAEPVPGAILHDQQSPL
jgi:hypothetical protein